MSEEYYKTQPITVPPNWTAELDFKHYECRFNETENYMDTQLARVQACMRYMESVIDRGLVYCGERANHLPRHLLERKIARLQKLLAARAPDEGYRDRFVELLRICRFAFTEYERLMPTYYPIKETTWLMPLVELSDYLHSAGFLLDEGLDCEHDDFLDRTELPPEHDPLDLS